MFGFLMGTLQKFKAAEETAKTSEKVGVKEMYHTPPVSG